MVIPKEVKKAKDEVQELKENIITAGRILENEGIYDYIGHVSARIPGTDRVLITPHLRELSFRDITPRDVVTLDLKGKQVGGEFKHPAEIWIHLSIYNSRPDVLGIIHIHPESCVIMSIAEVQLMTLYITAGVFAKGVPIFRVPSLVITKELGDELAKTLGECNGALLKWHGAVTVGGSVEEACLSMIALDRLCRIQMMASLVAGSKGIQPLPPNSQAAEAALLHPMAGWKYYISRLSK